MELQNTKYYTPSIEEFSNNLEFEYNVYNEDYDTYMNTWIKVKFDSRDGLEHDLTSQLNEGMLRVKYLDKEDIESLGWKCTGKSIDIWFEKEDSFDLESWTAHKIILHYGLHDNRLHIYADDPGSGNYELFRGTIKNKSELISLLKQIGI